MSGEVQSREEFEAWRAAAAEAHAASSGGGGSPGDDEAVPAAEVAIEQVYSARASPPGVDWSSLFLTISDQLLFLGFFAWLATPAMREFSAVRDGVWFSQESRPAAVFFLRFCRFALMLAPSMECKSRCKLADATRTGHIN